MIAKVLNQMKLNASILSINLIRGPPAVGPEANHSFLFTRPHRTISTINVNKMKNILDTEKALEDMTCMNMNIMKHKANIITI
jgi:hypothetical protein